MGTIGTIIALDSQCYTYLIEGLTVSGPDLASDVGAEKIALARIFFYRPPDWAFMIAPTVIQEFLRIRGEEKRANHISWASVLIDEFPPLNPDDVDKSAKELLLLHPEMNDCKVVAECAVFGAQILLCFDHTLIKRLAGRITIPAIKTPTEYWERLQLPKGSPPTNIPAHGNPLENVTWWKW